MQHFNMGSLELEGKIADLERKLTQRDEIIDKMKSEMVAAQKVSLTMLIPVSCSYLYTNNRTICTSYFIIVLMQRTNTVLE